MKKLREVWRGCTRNNVEADESYFVLNLAADWQPVEIVEKRNDVGRFRNQTAKQLAIVDSKKLAVDLPVEPIHLQPTVQPQDKES